jgi:hypothetical protein
VLYSLLHSEASSTDETSFRCYFCISHCLLAVVAEASSLNGILAVTVFRDALFFCYD